MFPTPLSAYPMPADGGLLATLSARIAFDPFNAVATGIFALAILHTFAAARFTTLAHRLELRRRSRNEPSLLVELLHFLGEVEVVFGVWAVVLCIAIAWNAGWETARHYINDTVTYTEALFVVVIMALASSRPIVTFTERTLSRIAHVGGGTPAASWFTILTIGPLLGSLITEPAAMTICALLLARQFYDLEPSGRLKYATLGLLFVNVSIGGTLTHFAAPPVLMVARAWGWDTPFMLGHFAIRAILAILISNVLYFVLFREEFASLARRPALVDQEEPEDARAVRGERLPPVPTWIVAVHVLFIAWTVVNGHYPALFIGGFLFFLGFVRATAAYQSRIELKAPLLVGFFLGALVIHGGLQGWWIAPVLSSLSRTPLFLGSTLLTAFNDNALITFLATLVPHLDDRLRIAVVAGAVTGGGLTVIANAPNPAGHALLSRFFGDAISPLGLLAGAALPTAVAAAIFLF